MKLRVGVTSGGAPHPAQCSVSPSYSGLDEVIFSYVLGVLEDMGPTGPSEENFDMDAFIEMMEAYVPGFANIPRWGPAQAAGEGWLADCEGAIAHHPPCLFRGTIGDMMQKLSEQLSGAKNKGEAGEQPRHHN